MRKKLFYSMIFLIFTFSILILTNCIKNTSNINKSYEEDKNIPIIDNTNIITKINIPYSNYTHPCMVNNDLILCANIGSEFVNSIIQVNTENKKNCIVSKSEYKEPAIQDTMANENWIMWVDATSFHDLFKIYARNIKTGKIKIVYEFTRGEPSLDAPYLYQYYIAWINADDKDANIMLYNLKTDKLIKVGKLNTFSLYNNFVHMENNKLLWTDCINNQGYYFIYDLATSKINKYKSEFKYPGYAKLSNNKIYSINFQDYSVWSSNEFGVYDLLTEKYTKITSEYINGFTVYKDLVGVISNQNLFELYKIDNDNIYQVKNLTKISQVDTITFSYKGDLIVGKEAPTPGSNAVLYLLDINNLINK